MQAIQSGDSKAGKMAASWAKLFRFSTSMSNKTVSLEQEVEHARNYITIQQMIFQDKFTTCWGLDQKAMFCEVIKLILQPIIKNAINHGLYDYASGDIIKVSTKLQENMLFLEVSDNGIDMKSSELDNLLRSFKQVTEEQNTVETSPSQVQEKGNSIALQNVYKRLYIYYRGKASMEIESKFTQGTKVRIVIPFIVE